MELRDLSRSFWKAGCADPTSAESSANRASKAVLEARETDIPRVSTAQTQLPLLAETVRPHVHGTSGQIAESKATLELGGVPSLGVLAAGLQVEA